jgi:hypothetical protein
MANKTCDCNDDASLGSVGGLAALARDASRVVSGRVTNATARALGSYCSTHRCTQSEALRKALVILSASNDNPEAVIAAVAAALDLPADTPAEDVLAAVQEVVSAITAPLAADASSEVADAVPPAPGAAAPPAPPAKNPVPPGSLSKHELAACKLHGLEPADYLARRDRAARRLSSAPVTERAPTQLSAETRAELKRRGMSEAEFRQACATAVKRI